MGEKKRILELDKYECGAVFESLNEKRNQLIQENRPTDTIDDVLLKVIAVINEPIKKEHRRNEAR